MHGYRRGESCIRPNFMGDHKDRPYKGDHHSTPTRVGQGNIGTMNPGVVPDML